MGIFKKSLKTLLDGSLNFICAKFHLPNPYRFRTKNHILQEKLTDTGQTDGHTL